MNSKGLKGLRRRLFFAFIGVSLTGILFILALILLSSRRLGAPKSYSGVNWPHLLVAVSIVLLTSFIVAYSESKRIATPIEAMSDMAQDMAQGKFYEHAFPRSGTEIDTLGHSLNFLASSLGRTIKELRRLNQRLLAVLEASVSGMIIMDGDGEVLRVNQAAERILGYPRSELEGIPYAGALRNTELTSLVERALYAKESGHREVSLLYPNERTVDAAAVPLWEAKSPSVRPAQDANSLGVSTKGPVKRPGDAAARASQGAVLVLHDLTDLRRLETVRSDFIQNISHELRTPITVVKGFAETLKDTPPDDLKTVREMAGLIDTEASRLADLVEKLLNLAKIESGHLTPQKISFNAEKALEDIVTKMESLARRKNQSLTIGEAKEPLPSDGQRRLDPVISADPDMFNMIFTNLIDNAIKYTDEGGKITVGLEPHGKGVLFHIQDNGKGISPDDLPRVFERFYRSAKDRSRLTGGSGLGLAIVKHCVAAHQGRVWADSQEGKGTTFFVWLPLVSQD